MSCTYMFKLKSPNILISISPVKNLQKNCSIHVNLAVNKDPYRISNNSGIFNVQSQQILIAYLI